MSTQTGVCTTLDSEFLGIRCRLIELAAALDRIDRHDGASDDGRLEQIRRSLAIIASDSPDRAERVQLEFSLPADDAERS